MGLRAGGCVQGGKSHLSKLNPEHQCGPALRLGTACPQQLHFELTDALGCESFWLLLFRLVKVAAQSSEWVAGGQTEQN